MTISVIAHPSQRSFSLGLYLLLVFALSWPFQIAYITLGHTPLLSYLLSSLSMVMVSVATFISGRFIFRDGFARSGWRWGKPKHYLFTLGLAAFVFLVPTLLEYGLKMRVATGVFPITTALSSFVGYLLLTLIPGFGEEFGWRGYMLPHLAQRFNIRKALLLHGLIWWAWHIPSIIGIAMKEVEPGGSVMVTALVLLLITLVPAVGNAMVYAYVWNATQSLAVASFYHAAYDEVRDTIERVVGPGPLLSIWEMLVTTILGAVLLWKANWNPLTAHNPAAPQPAIAPAAGD